MKLTEKQGKIVIKAWAVFLVGFYLIAGSLASFKVYTDKVDSLQRHQERLDPYRTEAGKTRVELEALKEGEADNYVQVYLGIYVDRIIEISTKATGWTVDFYVWFRWQDDAIDPGKTFQVIDGEIESKTKVDEFNAAGSRYALYRVVARITKFFNVVRYPLDNHLLMIRIEDRDHPWRALRYVPDQRGAEFSSRVTVPGYRLKQAEIISKPHAYKTHRGDPRYPIDHQAVYSQATYGIEIERPDWGLYFKMFQGLFAAVAIAIVAFLLGPRASDRISLGIGAFFASVASTYINLNELPGVGLVTMTDITNGLGMITIFLTLFASIISARIAREPSQHAIAVRFDHVSLFIFIIGFTAVNVWMTLSAAV